MHPRIPCPSIHDYHDELATSRLLPARALASHWLIAERFPKILSSPLDGSFPTIRVDPPCKAVIHQDRAPKTDRQIWYHICTFRTHHCDRLINRASASGRAGTITSGTINIFSSCRYHSTNHVFSRRWQCSARLDGQLHPHCPSPGISSPCLAHPCTMASCRRRHYQTERAKFPRHPVASSTQRDWRPTTQLPRLRTNLPRWQQTRSPRACRARQGPPPPP